MDENITGTERIYDGRLIRVVVHQVQLPDGGHSKREVVEHPGAVAVVALDDDQHTLLVRQFRLPAGKVLYELPAGTLEPGEPPDECARRELREETGYQPDTLERLGGLYVAPGYTTEYIHLYLARGYSASPLTGDADEFIEVERIPFADALAMIDSGQIEDGKTIAALLRVARQLG